MDSKLSASLKSKVYYQYDLRRRYKTTDAFELVFIEPTFRTSLNPEFCHRDPEIYLDP